MRALEAEEGVEEYRGEGRGGESGKRGRIEVRDGVRSRIRVEEGSEQVGDSRRNRSWIQKEEEGTKTGVQRGL